MSPLATSLLASPDTAGTTGPTPRAPAARRLDALDRFRGAALVAMLLAYLLMRTIVLLWARF